MIKLVCFVVRRPDLSREAFHRHWREVHGPLIAGLPTMRRHLVRYEQNHRLDEDYARGGEYDGSTIMWFESMAEYDAFAAEPDYAGKIAPDEAGFMDRSRTMFFFTEAEDVKWGGVEEHARARVKLLALLRRRRDLMPDAFHAHWSGPHAAIFERTPALHDTILAYQQNHRFAADYERDPGTRWDGLAEQWYASLEAFASGAGGPPFEALVVPDEERFMDRAATTFLLCAPPDVIVP
ncbi:MAG: EthD domain-containing protein [Spirochaetaceae bacterium]|nr:EthD domain-containing protein [Myxococcales bacterium]MCB9724285.1 EthD domain-containing protein [Spirochaetaceae bacterium]HPG27124.1 EthD domain-containing protein [Myxococcota bacterium]